MTNNQFKTDLEYYRFVQNLPFEIYQIYSKYWDETGRPTKEDSLGLLINDLLTKSINEKSGLKGFSEDVAILFPNSTQEESKTYYTVFKHGLLTAKQTMEETFLALQEKKNKP